METSKITTKFQTTIPLKVRRLLHLNPGDRVAFEVVGDGRIEIKKAQPFDLQYADAVSLTLSEWDSPEDDEAFKDL